MNGSLSWQRRILSNGLTVLLYKRPSAMSAQLSLALKYGSNDDEEEKLGTAHMVEHMLVGGSKKRIETHHKIEKLGGASYFETSKEVTFSMVDIFPERLQAASNTLSQLFFDTTFEVEKLEHERKVILNEIAEAHDDPRDKTEETMLKSLFRKHPARSPILGTKKAVSQITLGDVKAAHEKYYSPQNLILILTGKFSDKDANSLLEDFQDRKNGPPKLRPERQIETGTPKKETISNRSGISQAYLSFGFRTPPAKDTDIPTLELINAILGVGESSRLFVELREKRPLTYDYESVNVAGLDFGYFLVNCAVRVNSLAKTQAIIREELQKLKNEPVSKDDVEKGKNLVQGDVFRSIDSPYVLPRVIADSEIYFGDENALVRYTDRIRSLSEQEIMEVANKFFQEDNYATAIITPRYNPKAEAR